MVKLNPDRLLYIKSVDMGLENGETTSVTFIRTCDNCGFVESATELVNTHAPIDDVKQKARYELQNGIIINTHHAMGK